MMKDVEKKHMNCGLVLIMMTNESKKQGGPVSKTGEKWDHVQSNPIKSHETRFSKIPLNPIEAYPKSQ